MEKEGKEKRESGKKGENHSIRLEMSWELIMETVNIFAAIYKCFVYQPGFV